MVFWAVGNCDTVIHREKYVKELQKYMEVNVFSKVDHSLDSNFLIFNFYIVYNVLYHRFVDILFDITLTSETTFVENLNQSFPSFFYQNISQYFLMEANMNANLICLYPKTYYILESSLSFDRNQIRNLIKDAQKAKY